MIPRVNLSFVLRTLLLLSPSINNCPFFFFFFFSGVHNGFVLLYKPVKNHLSWFRLTLNGNGSYYFSTLFFWFIMNQRRLKISISVSFLMLRLRENVYLLQLRPQGQFPQRSEGAFPPPLSLPFSEKKALETRIYLLDVCIMTDEMGSFCPRNNFQWQIKYDWEINLFILYNGQASGLYRAIYTDRTRTF